MRPKAKCFLLACDKSGGHFYPAYTLACKLKERYPENIFLFYGISNKFRKLLDDKGFISLGEDFGFRNIVVELFFRFFNSLWVILRYRPYRVIGFGGRNSFWIVIWASLLSRSYIFEPNYDLGKANKFLAIFVKKIFLGFYQGKARFSNKTVFLGVPIREIFFADVDYKQIKVDLGLDQGVFTVFVLGGSQGSIFLNDMFVSSLKTIDDLNFQVIHITGSRDFQRIKDIYKDIKKKVLVFDYYENTSFLYGVSDLVVARAGANVLAEINYFGKKSFVFPLSMASNHQYHNAVCFSQYNDCTIFSDDKIDPGIVSQQLRKIILGKRQEKVNYRKFWINPNDFAEKIVEYVQV